MSCMAAMASAQLAGLVPITDVSRWLGHNDIRTTREVYKTYLVPGGAERARDVSDAARAKFTSMPCSGLRQPRARSPVMGRPGSYVPSAGTRAVYGAATPSREDSRAGMPPDLWASRRA
jgi:hypothetical protein